MLGKKEPGLDVSPSPNTGPASPEGAVRMVVRNPSDAGMPEMVVFGD